ncbi:flagellar basal body-associated FliL family protein [Methylocystis sp. S23]
MARADGGKRGVIPTLVPLAIVTIIGSGGGGFFGASLLPGLIGQPLSRNGGAADEHEGKAANEAHGGEYGGERGKTSAPAASKAEALRLVELPPIVVNLSGSKQLLRLQSAILFDPTQVKNVDALVASLRADVATFLSTMELSGMEGADGLRRLQEELKERAATRSEGHVREFIIEALVIQ